jgi:hypothetical protein
MVGMHWPGCSDSAIKWTRLSCRTFAANAVRLQLHAPSYNLGNFLRTLATPEPIKDWSLTSLKEKLIKIGARVVSHGRYVAFQMAEVAISRQMFQEILRLIGELRPQPSFDSHAFKSNRPKECVQMPERWPDQTLDQAFGLPEGAGRRPHLASVFQRNRKSPNIHTSSGVIWGMSV